MRQLLLTLIILGVYYTVDAQVRWGANIGMNVANMHFKGDNFNRTYTARVRWNLGLVAAIPINENWLVFLEPSYSGKGCGMHKRYTQPSKDSFTIKLNYAELPARIGYRFDSENGNHWTIATGIYAGYGFNGKFITNGSNRETRKHLHRKDAYYKRLDLGYNLMTQYGFKDKYAMRIGYSASLLNIERDARRPERLLNRTFSCSLVLFL